MQTANTGGAHVTIDGIIAEFAYTNTKTLRMRVTRDGTLKVSVPKGLPLDSAQRLVADNIDWAKKRLAKLEGQGAIRTAPSESDSVSLWGEKIPFRLTYEEGRKRFKTERTDDTIVMRAPLGASEDDIQSAIDTFLKKELDKRVQSLAPGIEEQVGKHAQVWRYRRMVSRWGSCNVKTASITLNIVLAELDPEYLAYVMCHELCHLWVAGHDREFYAHVQAVCPNWKRLRDGLNQYTPLT